MEDKVNLKLLDHRLLIFNKFQEVIPLRKFKPLKELMQDLIHLKSIICDAYEIIKIIILISQIFFLLKVLFYISINFIILFIPSII